MKRVIFLNRYFFPDHSATSQILSDLAFFLATAGANVHVITSMQLYDNPDRHLPTQENVDGVSIHRVRSTKFGRTGLLGRGFDYLSFYASARHMLARLLKPDDIVIAMTDPPLASVIVSGLARRRSAFLINWLQDIYPEVAVELGVPLLRGPLAFILRHFRDRSLKRAALNVVVGELMAAKLLSQRVVRSAVKVIPNWVDDQQISPVNHGDNPLRREWGLVEKFVVGYSGNLGRAHEFETILAASECLRHDQRFVFLFVGGGHRMDELSTRVKMRGLESAFRFFPYQDNAHLKYSLSLPDVHWLSLKPSLEGLIVPSKFYGIAAAGRPIIAITAKNGELAQQVLRHQCGLVIEPGQAEALADALRMLSVEAERTNEMGRRARAMLAAHFTRQQALEAWHCTLEKV